MNDVMRDRAGVGVKDARGTMRDTYKRRDEDFSNKPGWRVMNNDPYYRSSQRSRVRERESERVHAGGRGERKVDGRTRSLFMSHKDLNRKHEQFEREKLKRRSGAYSGMHAIQEEKWVSWVFLMF